MKTAVSFCFWILSLTGFAQEPKEIVAAIRKLQFLEGVWQGKGWIQDGNTKRHFNETETVSVKLGGTLMQIDVYGTSAESDSVIINSGLAVIRYNVTSKKYEMHFFQADGSVAEAQVIIKDKNTAEINLNRGSSYTRFVIGTRDNVWFEQAFTSSDGKDWEQFFEMKLVRQ
jgi:hypothetical protein